MGLLTAPQIAAIPSGRIAQKLDIICPRNQYWSASVTNTIHDETAGDPICVTRWGKRTNSVGNISPKSFGDISTMRCEITIDNTDGKAYCEAIDSDGIFYATGTPDPPATPFMAMPSMCRLQHSTYVWSAGAWSELPGSPWVGKIDDVVYSDDSGEATIIADGFAATQLREPWNVEHSYDTAVDTSYVPSGFGISSVTSGHTSGGNLWVQATSDPSCSACIGQFYYPGAVSTTNTPSPATSYPNTLHRFEDTSAPAYWSMCGIRLILTRASDSAVLVFRYPDVPYVAVHQSTSARPW